MPVKYNKVNLSEVERQELEGVLKSNKSQARQRQRAQILLWSDGGKSDQSIADWLRITPLTVARTRERWVKQGSLADKARPGQRRVLDGNQEAMLIALACSDAPSGREGWTMQMLADRLVELQVIATPISDETVRLRLKKTGLNLGSKKHGASQK